MSVLSADDDSNEKWKWFRMTTFLCDGPNGVMMQSFGARVECGDKSNQSKAQGALFLHHRMFLFVVTPQQGLQILNLPGMCSYYWRQYCDHGRHHAWPGKGDNMMIMMIMMSISRIDNRIMTMMTTMMRWHSDDSFVFQVKPVWLAEIGTRTAEAWDGTSWRSIPSLSRAKVVLMFIFLGPLMDIWYIFTFSLGWTWMCCCNYIWG